MSQVISDTLKRAWQDKKFKDAMSPEHFMDMVGKTISQTVGPYLQTAALQQQLVRDASSSLCKSMCAFSYKESACLFQFDFNGAPESSSDELAFVAMGSGQNIADPFLAFLKRLLWQNTKPSLPEGRLAAVWTIDHVRLVNPGGVGGPIQLATLAPKDGKGTPIVTMFSDSDIQEHLQQVRDAEKALINELRGQSQELNESPLPKVPN